MAFHTTGCVLLCEGSFEELGGQLIEPGLLNHRPTSLFQLFQQTVEVVAIGGQRVVTGQSLHHPEVRPATGQRLACLTAAQDSIHAKQSSEMLLSRRALQRGVLAACVLQRNLARAAAETLAQLPALTPGFERQLDGGQAKLNTRLQGFDGGSSGGGLEKQGAMQRFDERAFSAFVAATDHRELR